MQKRPASSSEVGPRRGVWRRGNHSLMRKIGEKKLPSERGRELHGVQIFVNLSARNKLATPRVLRLDRGEAPEWRSEAGNCVRVAVGQFEGVESPLVPLEPFTLLDVELRGSVAFELARAHNALVLVVQVSVQAHADGRRQALQSDEALALHSRGGSVTLDTRVLARQ